MIFFLLIALPVTPLTEALSYQYRLLPRGTQYYQGFQPFLDQPLPGVVASNPRDVRRTPATQSSPNAVVRTPSTLTRVIGSQERTAADYHVGDQQSKNLRALTTEFKALADDPTFTALANQNFKDLNLQCISNMDEAVATMESATDLFESILPESQAIVDKLKSIEQLKNQDRSLKEFSVVMRMMQPLVEKTSAIKEVGDCPAAGGLGSFKALAIQMDELAQSPGLRFNPAVRTFLKLSVPQLELSAQVIEAVKKFHTEMHATTELTAGLCKGSFAYARATMKAMGVMMEKTADLLSSFDFYYGKTDQSLVVVEKLRFAAVKMDQITDQLEDHFAGLETENPECPTSGSGLDLWGSADTLEDLSNIVEDIGVENLQQQFKSL